MHPLVANALRWHVFLAEILFGFTPRILSGFRTHERQHELFARPSVNPVAVPGTSQHEFGLAYDLAPDSRPGSPDYAGKIAQLRDLGVSLGMVWGGRGRSSTLAGFLPRRVDSDHRFAVSTAWYSLKACGQHVLQPQR